MRRFLSGTVLMLCAAGLTTAQPNAGSEAPDFPPGALTDGSSFKLGDAAGKVVVLYFFDKQ